ncbi:MAG: hypothetical protein HRU38_14240 [Saccharospirillaceae bacterium]|nr:hypothetical protein [Pseudomonadales bacterium]NRB79803.1 hypothetical protein [Saccharospirillaceae bacterium]
MNITWKQNNNTFTYESIEKTEYPVSDTVNFCVEKASALLDKSISDESQFFLVEWNKTKCELTISVTDQTKTKDSDYVVSCHFVELEKIANADNEVEWIENIQFAASNYLTTDADFLRFSLIALFTSEQRDYCRML